MSYPAFIINGSFLAKSPKEWNSQQGISYKNNYRREGIRVANAQPKVIIFCKSHPSNCTCKENRYNADLIGYWRTYIPFT